MDSQVVTPPMWGFLALSILVCGYPIITLMSFSASCSSLHGALPQFLCLVRCSHNHGSITPNPSNAVVWLPTFFSVRLSFSAWPAYVILVSGLLISSSKILLFFLNCTWSFLSSQIFKCPCGMASWIINVWPCAVAKFLHPSPYDSFHLCGDSFLPNLWPWLCFSSLGSFTR